MTPLTVPQIANEIGPMLLPYLPYLLKGAKKAGDLAADIGRKLGDVEWDTVFKIWEKLRPQVEKQPEVKEQFKKVAEREDEKLLAWELEKVLENLHQQELQEIHNLIQQSKNEFRTTSASGERSVAIGGGVSGSTITTGDQIVRDEAKKKSEESSS